VQSDPGGGGQPDPTPASSDALWIGSALKDGRPVTLPGQVLPTHVAVVGAAGSGKTWLAKVLAEEAVLQGTPVLAIDPQGDLVQFLGRPDPASVPPPWRPRYENFCRRVEPRILTPGSSHGIRLCLSPIRLAGPADRNALADPARRVEEQEGMLAALASSLVTLARSGGEEDSQRTFMLQVLKRLAQGPAADDLHLDDLIAAINRPEEVGLENADAFVKKAERQRLGRKLNTLRHGTSANLFTGGLPLDITRLCRPVTEGKVPLNVVYLNALHDDDQKQFFVAALAAEVYRWMTLAEGGGARLLFYLDEARDYIPAGTARPPAKMPLLRLFAQGRKYGVGCLLCTQSPRSVDYNAFGNCSTKVIGRLESAQDVERVAEWFSAAGPSPPWLRGRAAAPAGTFVARWPDMPAGLEGEPLRSRPLFSLHEGAWSPDRVEQEMRADPVRQALTAAFQRAPEGDQHGPP
jgi:DNA helicase HerA-like ATPase